MLERLEVFNFKSYKGHQVIGPFKTFSCVIGPNGAGKSNLMDAVSFVLGVRSAQLRSSQLKDLIYRAGVRGQRGEAGEEAEEDQEEEEENVQEAARKAWVLAVYKDTNGKEWKYQRTITLAGQSEYKVNNKVVTATEYNKNLESHSILVKAKNFLVFQGDVETVASQSPKDLTRMIEQISGSLELKEEYERAKAQQEKTVETSTHNFNKRRGINSEIKQFKEQKSEAEKFEQLRVDKDAAVVHHLLWKLFHINKNIDANAEEIETKNESLANMREEQSKFDELLKHARKEVASASKAVSKQEKELKKREKQLEEKRPALEATDTSIAHRNKKLKKAKDMYVQIEKEKVLQKGKVESLAKELAMTKEAANKQREEQRRKSMAKGLTLDEDALREYNDLKGKAAQRATTERSQLEALERQVRTKTTELASANDKLEQARSDREKLDKEQATLDERRDTYEEKVQTLNSNLSKAKKEVAEARAERVKIEQQTTELNEKLEEGYRKLQEFGAEKQESDKERRLKELIADLKRTFGSSAVRGRVVDLCTPTSRKYDTAITVVLGRNCDSIVVDTNATGQECIKYLKDKKAGTATFLPLDTITPKPINDKFRNYARGARLAIDVVEFEANVERAMLFACGNTLVCDNMDIAKHVAYEKGQEVKAVTLEGSMIHKSGLMTGGHDSRSTGRKWDEKEVETIRKQVGHFEHQLRELAKSRLRQVEDDRMTSDIVRLETNLVGVKDDLSITQNKLKDVKGKLKNANKVYDDLRNKVATITSTIEEATTKADELRAVVREAEDEIFAEFCKDIGVRDIRVYEDKNLKDAQAEAEARIRFDTQLARLTNQQSFEAEQLESLTERLETIAKAVTSEEKQLAELQDERAGIEGDIETLRQAIEEQQDTLNDLRTTLDEKTTEAEHVKKRASKAAKKFDEVIKEIAALNDEIEKLASERFAIYKKCKLEDIDLPLKKGKLDKVPLEENLRDTMAMDVDEEDDGTQRPVEVTDFGIEPDFEELDEGEQENDTEEMEQELLSKVKELQVEIDKMSPNMKAMDKLDEVEAKLAATTADFERTRKEAKEAKDRFNAVREKRYRLFMKAFNHIERKIAEVYKDLTTGIAGGGTAYLSLEDSDEPYLHGIRYHATPPMKRFRDMEQLSGGEKTMAALALLFAVHSFQPSPFFVLDEVDAALDNTNVGKIAAYIRRRASDDFQFIVISLKNSFWERARGLVGIWRDIDAGSSSVLTLDLDKYVEV